MVITFFPSQGIIWAEALFRVFDVDKSGALNFYEFMLVKNASNLHTDEDKLDWIFTTFDTDGGGSIDIDEVADVVEGMFKMAGKSEDDDEIDEIADKIMETCDDNQDGEISKEEFLEHAMKTDFILNLLKSEA